MHALDMMPQLPFFLGLTLLLIVSTGIWYNLHNLAKHIPHLISPVQRWLATGAFGFLAASVVTIGYSIVSNASTLLSQELIPFRWITAIVATINCLWYAVSMRSLLRHSENTREQLVQKQLLMQNVSQVQRNLTLRERVRETKRRHLKSQMNPHFLFNVLTGIQNLLQEGNSRKASTVFSQFRRLLILGFMSQDHIVGPLSQEMDHAEQYLELERIRLSETIEFKWNIASDIVPSSITCPLFILQPLMENAIWHGLSGTGVINPCIEISIRWNDQDLIIAVCDNGVGLQLNEARENGHKSRGTSIVKERLSLLRHRGQLEILDCPSDHPFHSGVMARMTLPLWSSEPTWLQNEERKAS